MAFLVNVIWRLDILWGFGFAIVMTGLVGVIMELLVFRKLANRGPVQSMAASIGVTLILQNVVKAWFGTSIQSYNIRQPQDIVLYQLSLAQLITFPFLRGVVARVVSVALIAFLHILLKRTTLGKAMRATADNAELTRTSGIKTRNVILWTWIISSDWPPSQEPYSHSGRTFGRASVSTSCSSCLPQRLSGGLDPPTARWSGAR